MRSLLALASRLQLPLSSMDSRRLHLTQPSQALHLITAHTSPGARLILQDDVQGVNDTGKVTCGASGECSRTVRMEQCLTENGEQDVDEQISTAAALQEDTQRGQDDGKDDLADVAVKAPGQCQVKP